MAAGRRLSSLEDPRGTIADPNARYDGAKFSEKTLLGGNARIGETRYDIWLAEPAAKTPGARPQTTDLGVLTKEEERQKKLPDIATAYATG